MSTYIYCRVSTFDQYITGHSIDAQAEVCLKLVAAEGLFLGTATNCGLPGVFVDGGKSAYTKKLHQRAGGSMLLNNLKAGDTVVVTATHRLFRNMADMVNTMEGWVMMNVSVRFVDYPMLNTNTANGKAMLYIFAVIAQMKSELISARTKEAMEFCRTKKATPPAMPVELQKEYPPPIQLKSYDVGRVMQEVAQQRDANRFIFTGKVRAYVRVSTKAQTVIQQKGCIQKYLPADLAAAETVWYEDEGESAFRTGLSKRKAGSRLMKDLQPGDIVVAWRTDRVFRSLLDMANMVEAIHAAGAYLFIVEGGMRTDNPLGKTMVSMISLMAEVESQEISRSTKLGLMVAVGVSPAARAKNMPKCLRGMQDRPDQKHFSFNQCFTSEERFYMYQQLALTQKQYRDRKTACRVISNQWLIRKGLPPMGGKVNESLETYRSRVKALNKAEPNAKLTALLRVLSKYDKGTDVNYPINLTTIAWVGRRQEEFFKAAKKFTGRIRDKESLTAVALQCKFDDGAKLIQRLS